MSCHVTDFSITCSDPLVSYHSLCLKVCFVWETHSAPSFLWVPASFLFKGWILFRRVEGSHFPCPFIHWWTLESLPCFSHCDWCCCRPERCRYVQTSSHGPALRSFGSLAGSAISGSYSEMVIPFLIFLKTRRTVFHSGRTIVCSQLKRTRVPVSLHLRSHWFSVLFCFF